MTNNTPPPGSSVIQPPQESVVTTQHVRHTYQVTAKDTVIVRWCPTCGKTWTIVRYTDHGEFTHAWKEIKEP